MKEPGEAAAVDGLEKISWTNESSAAGFNSAASHKPLTECESALMSQTTSLLNFNFKSISEQRNRNSSQLKLTESVSAAAVAKRLNLFYSKLILFPLQEI